MRSKLLGWAIGALIVSALLNLAGAGVVTFLVIEERNERINKQEIWDAYMLCLDWTIMQHDSIVELGGDPNVCY